MGYKEIKLGNNLYSQNTTVHIHTYALQGSEFT